MLFLELLQVVEIPNAGWAAVIVGYTFWAPARFSSFPVLAALILIEIAVIVVCTKLVTIVRLLAANDQVHKLKPDAFWFKNPKHILPLIRIALFVDSVIFPLFVSTSSGLFLYSVMPLAWSRVAIWFSVVCISRKHCWWCMDTQGSCAAYCFHQRFLFRSR